MCVVQGHSQHATLHVNSASVTLQLPVKLRFLSAMAKGRGSCLQVQTHVEIFFWGEMLRGRINSRNMFWGDKVAVTF